MLAPPRLKTVPASPDNHVIAVERVAETADEKKMIATAEAAEGKAANWWHPAVDGKAPSASELKLPHALTAEALDYYVDRVRGYGKTTYTKLGSYGIDDTDSVRSSLSYLAKVEQVAERKIDGATHKNPYVVSLSMKFMASKCEGVAFLDTVCGFPQTIRLEKTRTVLLSNTGQVLQIDGDGAPNPSIESADNFTHHRLALGLALVDHRQAKRWADAIPDLKARPEAQRQVKQIADKKEKAAADAMAWARQNRRPAGIQVQQGGITGHKGHRVSVMMQYRAQEVTVARDWAAVAPQDAAEWALNIQGKDVRESALAVIGRTWVARDANAMGKWFKANVKPVESRDLVLIHLIRSGAEDKPAQLANLLPYLESHALRRIGHSILVDRWTYREPNRAAALALQIEEQAERVRLLKHVATMWSRHGKASDARSWASRIKDAEERNEFLAAVQK